MSIQKIPTARPKGFSPIRSVGRCFGSKATALITVVFSVFTPMAMADNLTGVASVIDADTIEIHGERIRLSGIDVPESGQKCYFIDGRVSHCGKDAAFALADLTSSKIVSCDIESKDRYGRHIATCFLGFANINDWLVINGHALAYRRYSSKYISSENRAKAAKAGIWSTRFIAPWDWRKGAHIND